MPAPTTVDEFVDLVRKSAVLDEPRLSQYVQKLKADPTTPKDLSGVAGLFIRDGLLTYFQAEQFLQGKWKRFTIGKYKVLEKLGSGGMGQVFLCEHKLMRRRVAVKVLPTAKAADPSSLDRFYREARAVAALDHPNIVRAYDIDQDDNLHFLVMEYVDGASLQDIIRKTGPMDVTRACHYIYWSAVGLQHAHVSGLIHRDIKPGNILVDRQGVVKILDLGLARFFNDDQDLLTKKYDESVLGTADYLAPEQAIDSHTVDGRADIYSLGATFYFLLTGNPPFSEGSVAQKLLWHQTRTPKPVREVRPDVPADVAAVLQKMMAKKPQERYATPGELAEALLPFTQKAIPPPPDEEMPQLSAAAQGVASGPVSITSTPRTTPTAPKTPPPAHERGLPTAVQPAAVAAQRPAPSPQKNDANVALADADTHRNKPVPVVEPIPDSTPGAPIWEAISAETANAARADTDKKRREGSSRRVKVQPPEPKSTPRRETVKPGKKPARAAPRPIVLVLAALGGVLLIGGIAFAAYWFGFREKTKQEGPASTDPRTLVLTKHGGGAPLHYPSLQKALEDFRPGDTIVIRDEVWEEFAAATRPKDLVLTAEGRRVTWRAPPGVKGQQDRALLALHGAEGGRISGITFDCGSQVSTGLRLSGPCPGLVVEDVDIVNATNAAVVVHDCGGDKSRPVSIRKCRFANPAGKDARSAVVFSSDPPMKTGVDTLGSQNLHIHACIAEGPFTSAAFLFDGSASGVEIRHCRVWRAGNGVLFRKLAPPATGAIWRADIVGNTFHTLTAAAIRFDDAGQIKQRTENRIGIAQNFFAAVSEVAKIEGDANMQKFLAVEANSNFRKRLTPPGSPFVPTAEIDADVPTNPIDRTHFLLYDQTSPLFRAFGGKPVGAPPE
jgi:serine/threonine protein kinase